MSISESCSCGARIDLIPGTPVRQAEKTVSRWRQEHRHEVSTQGRAAAMGFPLPLTLDDD